MTSARMVMECSFVDVDVCWLEKVVVGVFGNVNHGEPLLLKVY